MKVSTVIALLEELGRELGKEIRVHVYSEENLRGTHAVVGIEVVHDSIHGIHLVLRG